MTVAIVTRVSAIILLTGIRAGARVMEGAARRRAVIGTTHIYILNNYIF